ncbi:uncharacterized protein [Anas acuta]|uniref:uncharacterized protein n=1 Tax=Anas acuta TaxID=28680 RepID=UPI0035C90850
MAGSDVRLATRSSAPRIASSTLPRVLLKPLAPPARLPAHAWAHPRSPGAYSRANGGIVDLCPAMFEPCRRAESLGSAPSKIRFGKSVKGLQQGPVHPARLSTQGNNGPGDPRVLPPGATSCPQPGHIHPHPRQHFVWPGGKPCQGSSPPKQGSITASPSLPTADPALAFSRAPFAPCTGFPCGLSLKSQLCAPRADARGPDVAALAPQRLPSPLSTASPGCRCCTFTPLAVPWAWNLSSASCSPPAPARSSTEGLIKRECAAAKKLGELLGGVNLMGGQSLMAWSCPIPAAKPGMEKPALGSPGVGHKARKAASLSVWLLAIYFLELAAVQVQHTACDVPRRVCDRGAAASTLMDGCGRVRVSVPIAVPVP